jgi:octaprenyl-diphosphate synthase
VGNPLLKTYAPHIAKIDEALATEMGAHASSEFHDPLLYSLDGGKRIRPLILTLSAECFGEADENVMSAACAVELLHTESIIHDDIIDNEMLRRQREPFHRKYGYYTSVLSGDFVLGLILSISSRLDNARITADLARTAMLMSEGEMMENRVVEGEDATFEDYIKTIHYKTATAFEAAAKIGAIMGGGNEKQIDHIAKYGRNIGIAYQIRDDLLDWKNEDKIFNMLVKRSADPRDVFNKMEEMLKSYSNLAREALLYIPSGEARAGLEGLIGFAVLKA